MFICEKCGKVIEDYEFPMSKQCHGYTSLGQPLTETIAGHCTCGGDFIEATQCKVCGEWFDNDGMHGVCECCLDNYSTVNDALDFGENAKLEVEVNGIVAELLTEEQINKILRKWCEENFVDSSNDITKAIGEYKEEYSEFLVDRYGECND